MTAIAGHKLRLKFTVRDAVDPVPGARVSLSGKTGTTGGGGGVSLKIGGLERSAKLTATVTSNGYAPLRVTVHVQVRNH